jgi:hypothetical protein
MSSHSVLIYAVQKPDLPPLRMPERFRHEIAYFMTPSGQSGVPALGAGEYWILLADAKTWYDDGVFSLVSPLDSENQTECELSDEQEEWLAWMIENDVQHVRLAEDTV